MSLEKLTLRNFQSHEKIIIEFDPHITTIVGPSDVGKSAIIRALSWVLYNQPSGEAFIKHGTDRVQAILRLDGNQLILRERGKENLYRLEEQEFKAFGSNVPTQIKDLLQVSEINIQRQFDSPFWFAESSGEVSRQLNKIVNLGVIDDALAKVAAQLRKANERVELSKERVIELERQVDSFAFVEAFSAQVSLCTGLQKESLDSQEKKVRLMTLGNQAASYKKISKEIDLFCAAAQSSLLHGKYSERISNTIIRLVSLIGPGEVQKRKASFKAPDLSDIETIIKEIDHKTVTALNLKSMLGVLIDQLSKKRKLASELQIAHDNLHKQFPLCPICSSPLQ